MGRWHILYYDTLSCGLHEDAQVSAFTPGRWCLLSLYCGGAPLTSLPNQGTIARHCVPRIY